MTVRQLDGKLGQMMFEDEVSLTPQQQPAKNIYKPIFKKKETLKQDDEEIKHPDTTGKDSRLSTAKSTV